MLGVTWFTRSKHSCRLSDRILVFCLILPGLGRFGRSGNPGWFEGIFSGPKKTPKHKDFTKNPMPESTLFRGLEPPKFFVSGLCFLFENVGKTQTQRILKGGEGGGGRKKNLCVRFLWMFFSLFFLVLCWVRAASGPVLENYLFALKVGLRWVFVNELKWVQKWVECGFLGAKVGQNASKPTFAPT